MLWATRSRISGRKSTVISMLPTGSVRPMVRIFRRMSGRTDRMVEYIRPMNRSGVLSTTAAIMSANGAASGANEATTAGRTP